jgi:hypothetical protein
LDLAKKANAEALNRNPGYIDKLTQLITLKTEKHFSLFDKLQESHICVYSGGNNCCGFSVIAGHPFPNVVEATFVSRKNIEFSREMTRSEIEKLMVPNLKDRSSLVWF